MPFYRKPLLLFLLSLTSYLHGGEPITTLTNLDGVTLNVDILDVTDDTVRFKNTDNNKVYSVLLDKLDEDSNDKLALWEKGDNGLSTDFDLDVKISKSLKRAHGSYYDYNDDRTETLTPKIVVQNDSTDTPSAEVKALLIIFGRPIREKGRIAVLAKQELSVPSLPPLGKHALDYNAVRVRYDNRNSYRYGVKYMGHAFFLLDGDTILESEFNPRPLADKDPKAILAVEPNHNYDKNFKGKMSGKY